MGLYLNQTYYGNLAYGIQAASRSYFGIPAESLSLAQCAMLAGLPQTPAFHNPLTNYENAKARQEVVLGLMVKEGYITDADMQDPNPSPKTAQSASTRAHTRSPAPITASSKTALLRRSQARSCPSIYKRKKSSNCFFCSSVRSVAATPNIDCAFCGKPSPTGFSALVMARRNLPMECVPSLNCWFMVKARRVPPS